MVAVTVITPSGQVRKSRPTPPRCCIEITSFDIGWMRNTSSQLTGGGECSWLPGPVIFQTLPWPVVPSLTQRFPFLSKAIPLAPGTPRANGVAVGGFAALGVRTHITSCTQIRDVEIAGIIECDAGEPQFAGLFGMEPTIHQSVRFVFVDSPNGAKLGDCGAPGSIKVTGDLSPVNPSIARGVVVRVVKVASFGNGNLSSSPQADEPLNLGSDLGANENRRVVNDRKTTRLIHRDFMFLSSVLV